jgi:hypothetical protein
MPTTTFTEDIALSVNGGKDTLALSNTTTDVGITIGVDTNIYRAGTNTLKTDDVFWAVDDIYSQGIIHAGHDTSNKVDIGHNGVASASAIAFNTDTNLYRNAANTLKTDDEFIIGINGGKDTLALTDTTADVGITIGADTNLYRSAANTLKTDDEFAIGINGGKDTLALTDTTANVGITIGVDTNLYRAGSNTLKTDDVFWAVDDIYSQGIIHAHHNGGANNVHIGSTGAASGPAIALGDSNHVSIRRGTGDPAGVVTANVGSLFLRSDGGATTTLYVKESGTGNTGWVAK